MSMPKVIFVDWDDTLLASSHLAHLGVNLHTAIPQDIKPALQILEASALKMLQILTKAGTVVLITNSETGWVELSAKKFLPGLVPMLQSLSVISARSTYENIYPGSPLQWKRAAMLERINHFSALFGTTVMDVVSIGDSNIERQALQSVNLKSSLTKCIKFAERPSVTQLRRELDLLAGSLDKVLSLQEGLDLTIMAKKSARASRGAAAAAAATPPVV